jgi:serine/threonine protein kinase
VVGGRYSLHGQLGEGGLAHVFRARDEQTGEWVALKRLRPGLRLSQGIRARFRNEVRALATLDHPHVVKIRDFGSTEETVWIAMELIDGATLRHWMTTHGPMPPRLAVDATLQICSAIAAAHDRGIIHRDVKPHNVLVDAKGWCRVVDFGLARLVQDPGSVTRTGLTMGTWGYMSPEQSVDAKRIDRRTDVFALGATLLALLSGRDPVEPSRDLGRLGDKIPEPLRWPLTRATMPEPDHRHDSVAKLASTLVRAREVLLPPPPETPPLHLALAGPADTTATILP